MSVVSYLYLSEIIVQLQFTFKDSRYILPIMTESA